mgnify:CR=1 FL=1
MSIVPDVDETKLQADFQNGLLNVHLPRSEEKKGRTIEVKVN